MALSDTSDDFPIYEGTLLASCYKVQAFLGEGSFGKVAKCADIVTNTKVAVKITKDDPFFTERALEEIKILKQLHTLDPDRCNLVRWNGSFFHERFICLEFELLDLSLLEYTQQRPSQCLSIEEVRPIIHQLATALLHLDTLGIMHGDLKPENVMVVDRKQEPLQVKLIDFGLARHVTNAVPGSRVQSLWYRAPEVILGLVFMEPADMWSLGLVAAELVLGYPLFPGDNEYDMMKFIVETLGQPPDYQLYCGQKSTHFFNIEGSYNQHNTKQTWRLKSPDEFAQQTGHYFRDTRYYHLSSLHDLEEILVYRNQTEKNDLRDFVDLLKKMLLVDKHGRIIPIKVLEHPFFTVEQHIDSSQNMSIENLTVDTNEAEANVTQQPSSQKKSVHTFELCNVASIDVTPQEETDFTRPENVPTKLEDEEDKAAHVQPEVVEESSCCVKSFFQGIKQAFSSCFDSDNKISNQPNYCYCISV